MGAQVAEVEKPFDSARVVLESLVDKLQSGDAMALSHADVERMIDVEGREILRRLLQDHIALRAQGQVNEVVKGEDGVVRPHIRTNTRALESIFGTVSVERIGYHARGYSTLFPLDAALNLPLTLYSHGVERRIASLAARMSFEAALTEVGATTGAVVPKRQAEEIAVRAAVDFDAFYSEREKAALQWNTSGLVVLTTDGKGVVMRTEDLREATQEAASTREHKLRKRLSKGEKRNAKRMATVAAVYTQAPLVRTTDDIIDELRGVKRPDRPKQKRPRPENKRVWASLERSMEDVIEEAFTEGLRRDPLREKTWVAVVDGNKTQLDLLRQAARRHRIDLTIIMDVIHVLEYLWKAARVFNAEASPEAEEWVNERFRRVLEGKASQVAAGIRRSATKRGLTEDARKAADKCAGYLHKHQQYLEYDVYLAAGYPIASGVIEGACRHLIKDRMDITGARWSLQGAEAVLRLRALHASDDFDAYWAFHERREQESNHDVRYADNSPPAVNYPQIRPAGRPKLRLVK